MQKIIKLHQHYKLTRLDYKAQNRPVLALFWKTFELEVTIFYLLLRHIVFQKHII